MTVIGLTGGIASGKSTAAGWMKDLGAVVIDADRLGHRVYEPGTSGFQAVVNEFGHDLVQADGTINRQLLGGRVFGDPDQMKRLTDIVWPEIRRLANVEVAELKRRDPKSPIVLEAAVLVEANWFDLVDEVWVITVDPAVARTRLMARNSLTEAQAQARIDSQLSNKERSLHAFVKIDNSGTLDDFHQAVEKEWRKLAKRAGFTVAKPVAAAPAPTASKKAVGAKAAASKPAAKAAASKAAPAKATASKATTAPKAAAAKPVAKAPAKVASKAVATKVAPANAAPKPVAKATATKAASVKATATKPAAKPVAAKTATRTRSASTQSGSTRTSTARPASRAATTRPAATRTVSTRRVATTATRPAAKASAATTSTRRTTVKPVAAKPAPRPVAGRRTGAK